MTTNQQNEQSKALDASLEEILEQAQRTAHTHFDNYQVISGTTTQEGQETYVLFVIREGENQKYVQLVNDEKQYLVSLPMEPFDYHMKIREVVVNALHTDVDALGGGYSQLTKDGCIRLYGSSGSYGPADHTEVAKAMTEAGVPARA